MSFVLETFDDDNGIEKKFLGSGIISIFLVGTLFETSVIVSSRSYAVEGCTHSDETIVITVSLTVGMLQRIVNISGIPAFFSRWFTCVLSRVKTRGSAEHAWRFVMPRMIVETHKVGFVNGYS